MQIVTAPEKDLFQPEKRSFISRVGQGLGRFLYRLIRSNECPECRLSLTHVAEEGRWTSPGISRYELVCRICGYRRDLTVYEDLQA